MLYQYQYQRMPNEYCYISLHAAFLLHNRDYAGLILKPLPLPTVIRSYHTQCEISEKYLKTFKKVVLLYIYISSNGY